MKTPKENKIEALEKKLAALKGKAVFYKDKIITVRNFKIFTTALTIITDEEPIGIELHLVDKFLEELSGEIPVNFSPVDTTLFLDNDEKPKRQFKEITPEQLTRNEQMENKKIAEESAEKEENKVATTPATTDSSEISVTNYQPTKENVIVKETLMDMLKKVSANPSAIPQAKAVCDIANTMVNIQKNEIQLIQMANKLK